MQISTAAVKELREQCSAGIMECRNALVETNGDMEKALQALKERGWLKAAKKAGRATAQGLIEAYVHPGGRIGAMLELNCETDFVARTDEFKELAHNLAMQIAAMGPRFVSQENVPPELEVEVEADCLLEQAYIKDPAMKVQGIIVDTIAKVGENIRVGRFARFELGK